MTELEAEIRAEDLRRIRGDVPGAYVVSRENVGGERTIYGPFASREEATDWGGRAFSRDFTGGVNWIVYDIDAAVQEFGDASRG